MIQGTGSDVGKSTIVTALARVFCRRGYRVMPFKPQNMSNNAAATAAGEEIARAQAVQAQAARVRPRAAMNPVLLKPQGEMRSQLVVRGRHLDTVDSAGWRALKPKLAAVVRSAFAELSEEADIVLVEGAGSPAEINLRQGDIANMGFALMVNAPTVLVADIHRGGSAAAIVGTREFLSEAERRLLKGYILNRFHGDERLLAELPHEIAARCGLPCLGVMPFVAAARRLPFEDTLALEGLAADNAIAGNDTADVPTVRVAVPRLAAIANFDDLDPLVADERFAVTLIGGGEPLPPCDLVVLCGSKAVRKDLAEFRDNGWHIDLLAHVRRGGRVIGICGGYQLLGEEVADPWGFEGSSGTDAGLGLLPIKTTLGASKRIAECEAEVDGIAVKGYVIHQGVSTKTAAAAPFCLAADRRELGVKSANVAGCYLHGLFAVGKWRDELYRQIKNRRSAPGRDHSSVIEEAIEELADVAEQRLDPDELLKLAGDY